MGVEGKGVEEEDVGAWVVEEVKEKGEGMEDWEVRGEKGGAGKGVEEGDVGA